MSLRPIAVAALLLIVAACTGGPNPSATPSASPTSPGSDPTGTPSPSPSPSPSQSPAGVVVTFRVVGEEYKVLLTDARLIAHARELLAGGEEGRIPSGLIVRGDPGVNAPWSWHIDPDSIEFADMTMEICDGLPSHIEDGTLTGDRYCPWSAEVIAVEPAP
jgi:hypothetical protein